MIEEEKIQAEEHNVRENDRAWIIALAILLAALLATWLWMTPVGWWEKIRLLGYAVCHQIEERSFFYHNLQSPLCARCTGMYLGGMLAIGYQVWQGRKGRFPPAWVMIMLGGLFIWFGIDGLNSFLHFFPGFAQGYQPSNLFRLITGTGVGLGIGAILTPLFNQTAWADWINRSFFEKWYSFPILLLLAALMVAGVYSQHPVILLPAMVISGLSVVFLLSSLHSVLALMLTRRSNLQLTWRQMMLPLLIGLNVAFVQILVTSLLRFLLTGTWAALHL
ncbi:MAG: DUF2085 domain-containing protein [Chloroflexi bacterium]|nr:DUF2085 domain-containing protein [Chloroflexota bacterium]